MVTKDKSFNKNILIAVDDSDNSRRAVSYVAQLLGGIGGFKVAIVHVIPEAEEDYFATTALRYCPSMAECILAERDDTEYHTLVVGRQGISRSEEFLFGSVSSKIVNHAKNCTVWVVE
jgi:nucleotide-binding universal stress UspA family protein